MLDAVEDQELGEEQEAGVGIDGEVERIGEIKPVAGARLDVGLVLVDQIAAVGGDRGEGAGRYVVGEVADALEARRVAEAVADADVEVVRIRIDLDRVDEVAAGAVVAGRREDDGRRRGAAEMSHEQLGAVAARPAVGDHEIEAGGPVDRDVLREIGAERDRRTVVDEDGVIGAVVVDVG